MIQSLKPVKKARIGLYTVGLKAYWDQFAGLKERLIGYGKFIESKLAEDGEVHNFGLVDDEISGRAAGEWFNTQNVDIIFQTHIKFSHHPDEYMDRWFAEAPTHHCAMSVGHNASLFEKVAELLSVNKVTL